MTPGDIVSSGASISSCGSATVTGGYNDTGDTRAETPPNGLLLG